MARDTLVSAMGVLNVVRAVTAGRETFIALGALYAAFAYPPNGIDHWNQTDQGRRAGVSATHSAWTTAYPEVGLESFGGSLREEWPTAIS